MRHAGWSWRWTRWQGWPLKRQQGAKKKKKKSIFAGFGEHRDMFPDDCCLGQMWQGTGSCLCWKEDWKRAEELPEQGACWKQGTSPRRGIPPAPVSWEWTKIHFMWRTLDVVLMGKPPMRACLSVVHRSKSIQDKTGGSTALLLLQWRDNSQQSSERCNPGGDSEKWVFYIFFCTGTVPTN